MKWPKTEWIFSWNEYRYRYRYSYSYRYSNN